MAIRAKTDIMNKQLTFSRLTSSTTRAKRPSHPCPVEVNIDYPEYDDAEEATIEIIRVKDL